MRYSDWKNDSKHHESHSEALRKAGERCYLIRPHDTEKCGSYMYTTSGDKAAIVVNVRVRFTDEPSYSLFLYDTGGGSIIDVAELTDDEFERIKTVRREVRLWIAGLRDELPKAMPWETSSFMEILNSRTVE